MCIKSNGGTFRMRYSLNLGQRFESTINRCERGPFRKRPFSNAISVTRLAHISNTAALSQNLIQKESIFKKSKPLRLQNMQINKKLSIIHKSPGKITYMLSINILNALMPSTCFYIRKRILDRPFPYGAIWE